MPVDHKSLKSKKTTQLLMSNIRRHNPVPTDTVSCWFKEFLRCSGIDTSTFTGYLTRPTSASKTKQVGLSLPEILKRGHWTNQTSFETFCNKKVVDN